MEKSIKIALCPFTERTFSKINLAISSTTPRSRWAGKSWFSDFIDIMDA